MLMESQADLALEPVLGDAMRVLGRLSKRDATKAAGALLRDQRPALRRMAIEALDTACDTEGRAAISDMLNAATKDTDENVADLARAAVSRCRSR